MHLRPYEPRDVDALADAVAESIPHLNPFMPWAHPAYGREDAQKWVDLQVNSAPGESSYDFVIEDDGRFLGACGLNQFDRINRRANLGYWLRASATGRGVATRAVRMLAEWAWARTDFERLEIVVALENAPSLRVAERAGAVREGVLRRRILLHDVFHDAVLFSLVRGR
jgi:ribosomal-protein-serine acetyltransferase